MNFFVIIINVAKWDFKKQFSTIVIVPFLSLEKNEGAKRLEEKQKNSWIIQSVSHSKHTHALKSLTNGEQTPFREPSLDFVFFCLDIGKLLHYFPLVTCCLVAPSELQNKSNFFLFKRNFWLFCSGFLSRWRCGSLCIQRTLEVPEWKVPLLCMQAKGCLESCLESFY